MSARSLFAGASRVAVCVVALALGTVRAASPAGATVTRTLANGLRVTVLEDHRLPVVQFQLLVPAGLAAEPPEQAGIANLTVQMLATGTASRDPMEFTRAVQQLGGTLGGSVSREATTVSGAFLAADAESGLELLADAVLHPRFAEDQFSNVRNQITSNLDATQRDPRSLADDQVWSLVFGQHPFGRPVAGTIRSLASLSVTDLRAFHRDTYRPDRAQLAIAGDVDAERILAAVDEQFGTWTGRARETVVPALPIQPSELRIRIVDLPGAARAELRLGGLAPPRRASDYEALALASDLLAGGPLGRLSGTARPSGAVAFRGDLSSLREAGLWQISAALPADSVGGAVARARAELRRLGSQPVPESELAPARRRARDVFPIAFETLGARLALAMAITTQGLAADYFERAPERIGALTAEQVEQAAHAWWDPDRLVIVAVGPAAVLERQLSALGHVEVVTPISATRELRPSTITETPTPAQVARGRELITLALTAHGGLDRLAHIKDSTIEGDVILVAEGQEFAGQLRQVRKEPYRLLFTTQVLGVETTQILDGEHGWARAPGGTQGVQELDSLNVHALRSGFASDLLHLLLAAADPRARPAWRGREPIGGIEADAVEVVNAAGERRVLFLDRETHRLVAMEQSEVDAQAGVQFARRLYGDWRTVDGVLWPFHEERLLNGERAFALALKLVRFNTGVVDETFARPGSQTRARPRTR